MGQKQFSDDDLLAAIGIHGRNVTRVAEELGVSRAAVRKRVKALPVGALVSRSEWNETTKVDALKDLQRKLLGAITPTDIRKASLQMKITAIGILEDKIRLNEGKATEHIAHGHYQQLKEGDKDMIKRLIEERTQAKLDAIDYDDVD